jgi:hypothetical protein
MLKKELEFGVPDGEWVPAAGELPGVFEQILSRSTDSSDYSRLMRFEPGADTTPNGPLVHNFWEEVFIVEGRLTDTRLGETFSAGMYACRPPGMVHGPWKTETGVLMVEFRHSFPVGPTGEKE